jgi:small-conductance mechanosensitive channel
METEEPSPEERRHIENLSVIPAAIVVYAFIGYFVYLVHIGQHIQPTFYVLYFLVVFMLAMPAAIFLSREIFYARKTHTSFTSGLKRFLGKMWIAVIGAVLFAAILETDDFALSSLINENSLLVITGIIWFVIWVLLVFYFRSFNKLRRID